MNDAPAAPGAIALSSPAFETQGSIPARYTCEGQDISPALAWTGVPAGARTLALIVDDPDAPDPRAPKTTWVHWVAFDIPANASGLPENAGQAGAPASGREGLNDWKRTGWGGPCPPVGRHRYFFKLFALDTALTPLDRPTKVQLEKAMSGHVLARGELIGLYQKSR
jgi:Raf kinase inhibitor-like YbhB/YbcL family protein